nr:hypothetical protein [uncultured bacterium]
MNSHIEELILLKKRQEGYLNIPSKERLIKIKKDFGGLYDFNAKAKEISEKIIKEAFSDNITLENIREIPEKYLERETILNKVADYLNEKEALEILEIEITKEDKYRIMCESAFDDGVLTHAEKEKLEWEAELLGLSQEKSNQILEGVREKLELAKPSDFILEIIKDTKKISREDIFNKITERPYSLDFNKHDLKITLQNLNDRVYFDENTKKYSLVEEIVSSKKPNQDKHLKFAGTKYFYSIIDLSLNNPYVSFNSFPQKQECQIIINNKNKYFDKNKLDLILRDVVYDGIASHLISTVTATNLDPSKAFIDYKHKIGKALNETEI